MRKYLKFLISLLFALAIALGLMARKNEPYLNLGQNRQTFLIGESGDKSLADYYKQSQELGAQSQVAATTFLAVGDIMLSRDVAAEIKKARNPLLPFSRLSDEFSSVDFSFGNLESVFSGNDSFNPTDSMLLNTPKDNIRGLVDSKFKILNLANNHALDQGIKGLDYTVKYLDDNGIKHIGAGDNLDEAWQPALLEQNGIKICFIGASYASANNNVARIEASEHLKTAIDNSKKQCDFIIATMHAGTEYARKPNQAQINFAHAAIDDGADMVIGSHPHWIQTMEKYCPNTSSPGKGRIEEGSNCNNPKYIFYSLGNFIFDQMWSQDTREGLALKIQISKNQEPTLQGPRTSAKLDKIELIPVIIENYSTPRLATPGEAKKILDKIDQTDTILK